MLVHKVQINKADCSARPFIVQKTRLQPARGHLLSDLSLTTHPYQELLARVKHDRGLAERLIAYERKRRPGASLEELCRRAIERLEHDNR